MVEPEPALAPIIPPVFVPIVQVKLLAILAVNVIFGDVPLHMVALAEFVTVGRGLIVISTEGETLVHGPEVTVL